MTWILVIIVGLVIVVGPYAFIVLFMLVIVAMIMDPYCGQGGAE